MYIFTYVRMYACMYIHICIYTYIYIRCIMHTPFSVRPQARRPCKEQLVSNYIGQGLGGEPFSAPDAGAVEGQQTLNPKLNPKP